MASAAPRHWHRPHAPARPRRPAEGVASSSAAVEIAHRVGVEVPVLEAVADVVNETISPKEAIKRLMEISVKAESFTK